MPEINGREYVKSKEAAELMGVTYTTLNNWRRRAKIKPGNQEGPRYIKMAGTILYDKESIEHYLMQVGA